MLTAMCNLSLCRNTRRGNQSNETNRSPQLPPGSMISTVAVELLPRLLYQHWFIVIWVSFCQVPPLKRATKETSLFVIDSLGLSQ